MILNIMEITVPVFALGLIGFLWARRGVDFEMEFVTRLVLNFSLPALLFATLAKTDISPAAIVEIAGAGAFAYLASGVVMFLVLKLFGLSIQTWWSASMFGNTGNIGLPLCLFAFGDEGLALAMVVFALAIALQFSVGLRVLAGPGKLGEVLKQPIVYAAILGVGVALTGIEFPELILRPMALVGQIAIPLMLITLGVSIAKLEPGQTGRAALVTVLRLVVLAAGAVGAGLLFDLSPLPFGVLVLELITPAAVSMYMMTARYGSEPGAIAGLVLISTAASLVLIPAVLPFLLVQ